MDRSWIDIPDKLSAEYANGINEFIGIAKKFIDSKGLVLCPCCRCVNKQSQNLNVIKLHLLIHGFQTTYKKWYYHGEEIDKMEEEIIFNAQDEDIEGEQDDLATGLNDAINSKYFDINTLKTQCSGVCPEGDHDDENLIYYGVLIEILELSFLLDRKVFLFRCKWYNSSLRSKSIYVDNNLTSINTSTDWYANEPFILSTQAQQVFYLLDLKRGSSWRFAQKVNHLSVYDIPETSEVVNDISNNDVFQEEESFHLPSFQPIEDIIESSSLVRRHVTSLSLSSELVVDLFSKNENQPTCDDDELDEAEENEIYDDGNIFIDEEVIFSSDKEDGESETELDS